MMGGGGGGGPLTPQASQVLKERSGVTVLLLTFVTCGIYGLIWKYQTTDELRIASGDESIKPGLDLVLAFVTCGIWAIYTDYRNAKKLNDMLRALGSSRSDQSTIIILLWVFGLGFASIFLLQEEFNALAKAARGERVLASVGRRTRASVSSVRSEVRAEIAVGSSTDVDDRQWPSGRRHCIRERSPVLSARDSASSSPKERERAGTAAAATQG